MDSKRPPSLAICLSAPIFVTATRIPMNAKKPLANNAPFSISSGVNWLTSLHTPIINMRAMEILISIPPTLSIFLPAVLVASTKRPTNAVNPAMNAPALPRSGQLVPERNFTTLTRINKEKDIFKSISPALSMF